ncbi:MAG: hypothetical protein ACLGIN_16880 [Candidatus Sericytochromatia bacterium]
MLDAAHGLSMAKERGYWFFSHGIEDPMVKTTSPSLFNLFFTFFPARYDAGDPQMDLEAFYNRY